MGYEQDAGHPSTVPTSPQPTGRGQAVASPASDFAVSPPAITMPKGGGAIKGVGEKFSANPVTGTGSMSVPIATSPGRGGFGPQLALSYDSGAGNGPFGLGWSLSLPSIARKTDKGLPRYLDGANGEESDTFILAGAEDLVPIWDTSTDRPLENLVKVYGEDYRLRRYRPRVEGLFAWIERWSNIADATEVFWRTITRDNITTWYGRTPESRVRDPADKSRIFQWFVCESYDDKGNVAVYHYQREDGKGIDVTLPFEANRPVQVEHANTYIKRIRYGNLDPYMPKLEQTGNGWFEPDANLDAWMFELVFDYGDHPGPSPARLATGSWTVRHDPFSTHRPGFEVRTSRLCRRVLMYHHFPKYTRKSGEQVAVTPEVGSNCLVRSTDVDYAEPTTPANPASSGYTVLKSVTHRSYQRTSSSVTAYQQRELPPVSFTYSGVGVDTSVQTIGAEQLENLPVGTQGPGYQWVDLDGEGLSGVLAEHAGAWHFKPNRGGGHFGPMREVARTPSMAALAAGRQQLMDLSGNGEIDLVDFSGPVPGFHERDRDEGWKRHVPFASLPNIDWSDPQLRFVDLTGDGHADALITEHEAFTWYPSLAERGFSASQRAPCSADEDSGPRLVFADGTQTIFLADMCGDGLTGLLRVRNGDVCYWPNLGYGRFGRKVTLGNAPRFDHPDLFDPRRIRLADLDGSGPTDLIYLGRQGAQLYFNRSGNSLSDALPVPLPVATENLAAVQVADLLGNGTACLVWNSHLPADANGPVRYIDLMGGTGETPEQRRKHQKPHLLIEVNNNLGGRTEIEYTPSTHYYLQDLADGRPWVTRLPFPVHCVSRVTVHDQWRGTAFSSTYSYHHGYFDGAEREFRGFGRVEQVDVEDYGSFAAGNVASPWVTADHKLYQPPVHTITWYHTGAALDRPRILAQFAHEYFPQRFATQLDKGPGAFHERELPEPELPANLNATEWREALRTCKGMVLRQEVYELDVDDLTASPQMRTPVRLFSAATHNCRIQCLQRQLRNAHAVFLVTESEATTYHYELQLRDAGGLKSGLKPDPRIAHTINLRHDEQGNPQQTVAIRYGRWQPGNYPSVPKADLIRQVQAELHVALTEIRYTDDVMLPLKVAGGLDALRHHRLRLPCEARTFELRGIPKPASPYYSPKHFEVYDLSDHYGHQPGETPPPKAVASKAYHEHPDGSAPQRRIVEHTRTLYFADGSDTSAPATSLPFGRHGPRGLKYEDYKLALTDALLTAVFGKLDPADPMADKLSWELSPGVTARSLLADSTTSGYVAGTGVDPALTNQYWLRSGIAGFAADAHEQFFLPERFTDAYLNVTTLTYDPRNLFVKSAEDAKHNITSVLRFDHRVLAPLEVEDINGNHTEAAFDIRGLVVALSVKGKRLGGRWQGDDGLAGWSFAQRNPATKDVADFCVNRSFGTPQEFQARTWLGTATTRFVYHFGETRDAADKPTWLQRMAGACAIARETHLGQLEPGNESKLQISLECTDGSGALLMKKVQAEPDPASPANPPPRRWLVNGLTVLNNKGKPVKQYEPAFSADFGCEQPAANGVCTTLFYDAPGRLVRTEFADGSIARVEFSPWDMQAWDQNDSVQDPGCTWYSSVGRDRYKANVSLPPINPVTGLPVATPDERAGWLAAQHAATPATTILDSLGREVISVAHNRAPNALGKWLDERTVTYTKLDAEGKPLWIRDALGHLVMQYITPTMASDEPSDELPSLLDPVTQERVFSTPCYDIAGNLVHQRSMDSGDRWMLTDASGKPMLGWDINDRKLDDAAGTVQTEHRLFHTQYDALHRPVEQWLRVNSEPAALIEAFEYCDTQATGSLTLAQARKRNLVGQAVKHHDTSGLATVEKVDFKGALEEVTRTLLRDVQAPGVDWNVADRQTLLEADTFRQITGHDALGRMTTLFNWHLPAQNRVAIYLPKYNERGLLQAEDLVMRATGLDPATGTRSTAIRDVRYNTKGQKEQLTLGNDSVTDYTYDAKSFRLLSIHTSRPLPPTDACAAAFIDPRVVQDLRYTYDAAGNITEIADAAVATTFGHGQRVDPVQRYEYDALYRLISATGRENGAAAGPPAQIGNWPTAPGCPAPDPSQLRNYTQRYRYDSVGNILQMNHQAGPIGSWVRDYRYAFADLAQAASNRLWQTTMGAQTTTYRYDVHGSMLNIAATAPGFDMRWDWRDMIRHIDLQGGGHAWYQYDIDKRRTRKRLVRNPTVNDGTIKEDRIYLRGYELYRRYTNDPDDPIEVIESHHLFEGDQRVLLVDDVIRAKASRQPGPNGLRLREQTVLRYQYANHLDSVGLELDQLGRMISYEEFHPYGATGYRLQHSKIEISSKQIRYKGLDRDEESGLDMATARYYFSQHGRWISSDPGETDAGGNSYEAYAGNPVLYIDPEGKQARRRTDAAEGLRGGFRIQDAPVGMLSRPAASVSEMQAAIAARDAEHQVARSAPPARESSVAALQHAEGSYQASRSWRRDFHNDVGLPVTVGVGVAVVFVAGGGVALTAGLVESGAGVASGYIRAVTIGVADTAAMLRAQGLVAALYTAAMNRTLLATATVVVEGTVLGEQVVNPVGLGGPLKAAAAEQDIVSLAKSLHGRIAAAHLEAEGRVVTEAAVQFTRRTLTVAVMQGTRAGKTVTLLAVNDPTYFRYAEQIAAAEGLEIVMGDALIDIGKQGYPLARMGFEHAERPLYRAAEQISLESPRVASSNLGCWDCQWGAIEAGVTHLNPKPIQK